VRRLRQASAIEPLHKKSPWRPEDLRLLGRLPDTEIARRTGRARATVTEKRHRLGIPRATNRPWRTDEDAIVRANTIKRAARLTGRTERAVAKRRSKLKRQ
jgi:hypothetical protein